ncbi:O-antigen ligase domain-containing protein [Sporolactobacillus sp. THM7-7]|nr:O-antigen ligase domain-containing protein [Sporolactobacillus sp. THM7-7]
MTIMNGEQTVQKQSLTIGLVLLYILPPMGMAWLVVFAISEWIDLIKQKHDFQKDFVTVLLVMMLLASIGAAISNRQFTDLLSTLILIGYLGIYLYTVNHPHQLPLKRFIWLTIFGGIYIFFSDKMLHFLNNSSPIGQAVSFLTGHFLFGYSGKHRLFGSTFNPNYACYLLILALAFLLVELLHAIRIRNKKSVVLMLVFMLILDFGIYETGSRAGFVIMLLLKLLFLFKLNRRWAIAASFLVVFFAPTIYQWIPRTDVTASSMDKRIYIWKTSLRIFMENPVFGTTSFGFREESTRLAGYMIPHAHDLFLAIFSTSGIFCGLFFIGLILISGYGLVKAQRIKHRNKYSADLFLFALPTIIAYGIMDLPLSSPQIMIVVLILMSFWMRYMKQMELFRSLPDPLSSFFGKGELAEKRKEKETASIRTLRDHL